MNNPFEILDRRQSNMENILLDLSKKVTELKSSFEPKQPNDYLTRSEVANLLKIDLSTIHHWCKSGKLQPYGIGSRIYFKRSDIENSLVNLSKNKGDDHD